METPMKHSINSVMRELNKAIDEAGKQHDWPTLHILRNMKEDLAQTKMQTLEYNLLHRGRS